MIRSKEISILPDRSLMPKIGQTGYSISQAVAELIDNSIDARKDGQQLKVKVFFDSKNKKLTVSDNGTGMDEQTAANSIKLAHSTKKNKLGEFGLGLKTAATSLGKAFEISTTKEGHTERYILAYDEEEWLKNGDWTKHEMKIIDDEKASETGTTITISNVNFVIHPNLPGNIRKDLSSRFAPYIENGEAEITVNGKICIPEPLELKSDYFPPDGKETFRIELESGNEVWGWRGLLVKGSDRGEYGFRVFRRGRLIMQFAKMGFNPHPESRQIVGELHLDHVPVTHNKREFIEESPLFKEINEENGIFWNFMRDIVRYARSSMRKTHIDQGILDKVELQKQNIMKAIKQLPELKQYAFPDIKDKKKGDKDKHDGIDEIEIEKRDRREIVEVVEEPTPKDERGRKPKKTQIRKIFYLYIKGKRYKIEHSFIDLKTDSVLKDKNVSEETGIQVFTNTSFPAFANTKDHLFYAVWNIAEAVAEIMIEKNSKADGEIIKIRDLILKRTAEIALELDEVEKEKKIAEKLRKEYEESLTKIKAIEEKHI